MPPNIIQEISEALKKFSGNDIYGRKVVLFNDEKNSFDHVEDCIMRICFKNKREAKRIALEAHNKGKSICYEGSFEECETVSERMAMENLTVSLD